MKLKSKPVWRTLLFIAIAVSAGILSAWLRTTFDYVWMRIVCRSLNYFISLLLMILLFRGSLAYKMLPWCAGVVTTELAVQSFYLLISLTGGDSLQSISLFEISDNTRDIIIYIVFHLLIIVVCAFLFGRSVNTAEDIQTLHGVTVLSCLAAVFLCVLNSITRDFSYESPLLYRIIIIYSILLSSLILLLRANLLSQGHYRKEIDFLNSLLTQEKKQYVVMKTNIETINIKVHDLKHRLQNLDGRLTEQEMEALKQAVDIYANSIKTGNEALDVVLYEKQLLCQQTDAKMSCIADGAALCFMKPSHIYALFSNALDYAIEAVSRIPTAEKRIISVAVMKRDGNAVITVTNYYENSIRFINGIPVSSKDDANHHVYGFKSMCYIAEHYEGTLTGETKGDRFCLTVQIPLTQGAKAYKEGRD